MSNLLVWIYFCGKTRRTLLLSLWNGIFADTKISHNSPYNSEFVDVALLHCLISICYKLLSWFAWRPRFSLSLSLSLSVKLMIQSEFFFSAFNLNLKMSQYNMVPSVENTATCTPKGTVLISLHYLFLMLVCRNKIASPIIYI